MNMCPCKGCEDRKFMCHGSCDEYKAWKQELEDTNKWLRDQQPVTSEAGKKGLNRKLKTGKSRKWNLKNQYRGDS